jgi:predicted DNA-binding antitoxin AbrB/MazE fold protein
MEQRIRAVYNKGVFQPLEAVALNEDQHLMITISDTPHGQEIADYFTPEEWSQAATDCVSLDEVRQALATIPGALSDAIVAMRQER